MEQSRVLPPFKRSDIDKGKLQREWVIWKRSLECYFESEDISDQKKKRSKLLHFGGPQLQALFQNLPDVEKFSYVTPEKQYYNVAIQAFDDFFKPGRQDVLERHKLRRLKQLQGERFAEFVVRVRQQIGECGLEKYPEKVRGILFDIMLVDTIAEGCRSEELRKRFLQKDRSVEEIEKFVKSLEEVEQQIKIFGTTDEEENVAGRVYKIQTYKEKKYSSVTEGKFRKTNDQYKCFKCGFSGHISSDTRCPARGRVCNHCKRVGHFESQCRIRKSLSVVQEQNRGKPKRIRTVEVNDADEHRSTGNVCSVATANAEDSKRTYYAFYSGNNSNMIKCVVGGINLEMLVDSGAEVNLVSELAWERLKAEGIRIKSSERGSMHVLKGYASDQPMTILGTFVADIAIEENLAEARFFVIKSGQRCLLGDTTAKELGVLKIGVNINQIDEKIETLSKINDLQIHIHMNQTLKPVFQPVSKLPVALEDAVNRKLDELMRRDIIEEKKGPTSWVSPLVIVGKANGEPRICLDLRRVNAAVLRERHPMPSIDDFLARVGRDMIRSKLDIMDSFLQLELDEESRDITTFFTNRGILRFKRMPFGLVTAPEIFQKTMDSILAGCDGAWWYIDDIYIEGKDDAQHDARLNQVLLRLKKRNVQLNWKKCVIGVTELEFLGHKIMKVGISPSNAKIEALLSFRKPENANETRSFLGLANYLNRYIPNLASIDKPLRELTKKGVIFKWEGKQDEAFQNIKKAMTESAALGFFNVRDRTLVMADNSPSALGAILVQVNREGEHRIISYASKLLTETERRYCHTEKEALSLVWSVEKFYIYLYGKVFELLTDCKALVYLFTHRSRPCARIERWVLRLQSFEYVITYIPGDQNIADVLSRLTTLRPVAFDELEEVMVKEIANMSASAVAIEWKELVEATNLDPELQHVIKSLQNNSHDEMPIDFRIFANELCCVGEVLLRIDRVVVPVKLRDRVLEIAHAGHLGIRMMKTFLRAVTWWPKMDKHIEMFVRKCQPCTLVAAPDPPEPMIRKQLPTSPWEEIAIDFLGPLPEGQYLLVAVDYYSRYVEVAEMTSITTKDTVVELATMFSRYGIPRVMRADNGPQLSGDCVEFRQFCKEFEIDLVNTTPYWPQANSEVERQNRTILKRLRIAQELGQNWRMELRKFLLAYHATDHSITGKSPSEMMFGRRIRSKLPAVPAIMRNDSDTRDRDRLFKAKGKMYADARRKARTNPVAVSDKVFVK
ncbi:uncharacterized protein K02A2.6-like isoform X1 [Toxorhynchites rutilus septentrionalis]|uniref:uncharacterized protein K02A2.6-like isoform X1 n=1 Tax=Toxorhynchites rutilus septentrionalis TaxID=329112 RepID=UPI002479AA18|nr:uncharacterized protein K02A2.6-like isoform X1 [Toxorhynchites rutilus septentrionalis]XP_055640003.1 uncharacterized protein K02A2.6-like isoform X1 [Toxorhynchites rutilus septentrionalis]XP_055640004.1 uncharacterized protein K02A2.6-like isoform X1 [Toxorhynchites rutilus septentrionalis]